MKLRLCLDCMNDVSFEGRIYTLTKKEPIHFTTFNEFVVLTDKYFDEVKNPQAFQERRSLIMDNPHLHGFQYNVEIINDIEQLRKEVGLNSSYVISIRMRQNTDWQGSLFSDDGEINEFENVLELLKLIVKK